MAYPVHARDREVHPDPALAGSALTGLLVETVEAVLAIDPQCRRVVYAAPEGDLERLAAAERAGFRFVVAIDLPDGAFSLSVAEPDWVIQVDMDLDHVPGT